MISELEIRKANKIRIVLECLEKSPVDIQGLRECSVTEFGFVHNSLRKKVWPILLNIDTDEIINHTSRIVQHPDTDQVAKDVERSMWRFTKGNTRLIQQKRPELTRIINAILSIHPKLHYFQGYHDIASVLLLVTDESLAFAMLERLSLNHIRDCMLPSFAEVLKILNLCFPLVSMVDPKVYQFLLKSDAQPMFALSWIITWFSHNLEDLDLVARVFDYFLSSHPLSVLYFSVNLIKHLREGLLNSEPGFDVVHGYFSHIPDNLPLDLLIQNTQDLIEQFPPSKLQAKANITNEFIPISMDAN
eukprot:gene7750-9534_t